MNKNMRFFGGLLFLGYSTFQILGFLVKAFPATSGGAILMILLGLLLILIAGFNNWLGIMFQYNGITSKAQNIAGFAPVYALGSIAFLGIIVGLYAAS